MLLREDFIWLMLKDKHQDGETKKKRLECGRQKNDPPRVSLFQSLDVTLHGKGKND